MGIKAVMIQYNVPDFVKPEIELVLRQARIKIIEGDIKLGPTLNSKNIGILVVSTLKPKPDEDKKGIFVVVPQLRLNIFVQIPNNPTVFSPCWAELWAESKFVVMEARGFTADASRSNMTSAFVAMTKKLANDLLAANPK